STRPAAACPGTDPGRRRGPPLGRGEGRSAAGSLRRAAAPPGRRPGRVGDFRGDEGSIRRFRESKTEETRIRPPVRRVARPEDDRRPRVPPAAGRHRSAPRSRAVRRAATDRERPTGDGHPVKTPRIAAAALLVLGATACSVSTGPDQVGLEYDAGAFSATTFDNCIGPG